MAFCLAQLSVGDKGFHKLADMYSSYKDSLGDAKVYASFQVCSSTSPAWSPAQGGRDVTFVQIALFWKCVQAHLSKVALFWKLVGMLSAEDDRDISAVQACMSPACQN